MISGIFLQKKILQARLKPLADLFTRFLTKSNLSSTLKKGEGLRSWLCREALSFLEGAMEAIA